MSRKLPPDIQTTALRKLRMLNNARILGDLSIPPNNHLDALKATAWDSTASASTGNGGSASYGPREERQMSKSSIIAELVPNPTPGAMLFHDFIQPMGLTQLSLARAVGVAPRRINEIVLGKRAVTADTDLRLARYFGISEGFWLGVQADFDLLQRRRQIEADLDNIEPRDCAA